MILNVNLPTKKEDSIDLSEITPEYKGVLILFITDKCAGFIIYDVYDDTWKIYNNTSLSNIDSIITINYDYHTLVEMVNTLQSEYDSAFSIKAIPFEAIKK